MSVCVCEHDRPACASVTAPHIEPDSLSPNPSSSLLTTMPSVLSAIWWRGGVGCRQDTARVAAGAAPIVPIRRIRPTQKYPAAQESGGLHRSVAQRYSGVAHYLASERPRSALPTCLMRDSSLMPPWQSGNEARPDPPLRAICPACLLHRTCARTVRLAYLTFHQPALLPSLLAVCRNLHRQTEQTTLHIQLPSQDCKLTSSIQAAGDYFSDAREHAAEIRVARAQYMRDHGDSSRNQPALVSLLAVAIAALGLFQLH